MIFVDRVWPYLKSEVQRQIRIITLKIKESRYTMFAKFCRNLLNDNGNLNLHVHIPQSPGLMPSGRLSGDLTKLKGGRLPERWRLTEFRQTPPSPSYSLTPIMYSTDTVFYFGLQAQARG